MPGTVSMRWKLISDNFPGIVLNISVEVMVTLNGESKSHIESLMLVVAFACTC